MEHDLRDRLRAGFRWTDPGPGSDVLVSDRSLWWRDAHILDGIGAALAALYPGAHPTVVVSPEVTGFLLGPLVARACRAGFVEAYRKGARRPIAEAMTWVELAADHRGDPQHLGVRTELVTAADRVLIVDDWAATGAQAGALRALLAGLGATVIGTAVIVDETPPSVTGIRGLLSGADLDV